MDLRSKFCLLCCRILLHSSLYECRLLDGYSFPVYTAKYCPRNATEWNQRSSALNCTEDNGYVCLPNESITELLEFCYMGSFILIQEGICLYLSKRYSAVYSYSCNDFQYGCPNSSHVSYKLFENVDQVILSKSSCNMGWALKRERKNCRFDSEVRDYLQEVFEFGLQNGKEVSAHNVSRNMRVVREDKYVKRFQPDQYFEVRFHRFSPGCQ